MKKFLVSVLCLFVPVSQWRKKLRRQLSAKKLVSYSQIGEDCILFAMLGSIKYKKNKLWLDIGAHSPTFLSNTRLFSERGYTGVNVEADSSLIGAFHKQRPNDLNLNVLISNKNAIETFFLMKDRTLNTISESEALHYEKLGNHIQQKIALEAITIPTLLEKYCDGIFPAILLLDAEGYDFEILQTIEWHKTSPQCICVEIIKHGTSLVDAFDCMTSNPITSYLLSKGYAIVGFTSLNAIFLKDNKL